jgi:hypothetical protein
MRRSGAQFFQVLFLDLLVTALIISGVLVALLQNVQPATFKAKFVEVLYAMATERATLIERHAYSGAWTEPGAIGNQEAAPSAPQRGYQLDTADGGVVASGTLSGRRFAVGMRPAVADPAAQWSVLWLCGPRQPPAGWTASTVVVRARASAELPEELVVSVCRAKEVGNRVRTPP